MLASLYLDKCQYTCILIHTLQPYERCSQAIVQKSRPDGRVMIKVKSLVQYMVGHSPSLEYIRGIGDFRTGQLRWGSLALKN